MKTYRLKTIRLKDSAEAILEPERPSEIVAVIDKKRQSEAFASSLLTALAAISGANSTDLADMRAQAREVREVQLAFRKSLDEGLLRRNSLPEGDAVSGTVFFREPRKIGPFGATSGSNFQDLRFELLVTTEDEKHRIAFDWKPGE